MKLMNSSNIIKIKLNSIDTIYNEYKKYNQVNFNITI